MLGKVDWLQRSKHAAFVDGFKVLGRGEIGLNRRISES
jgi:hypothetical protein